MKPYTNKTDKIDSRKCLYSEIKGNNKARKKAARREGINQCVLETLTNQEEQDFTYCNFPLESGRDFRGYFCKECGSTSGMVNAIGGCATKNFKYKKDAKIASQN